MPVEDVRQDPAEEDANRPAARGDEPEDAHRLGPLGRLREEGHHQRKCDSGDNGGAEPLDGARYDEHLLRCRQTAGRRCEREDHDPG